MWAGETEAGAMCSKEITQCISQELPTIITLQATYGGMKLSLDKFKETLQSGTSI
jgi:hypothetical protein